MRSSFFGLEIARKALFTQQQSLDITAHNIANAGTKGYSRQSGIHSATSPGLTFSLNRPTYAGLMGTGVEIQEIRRMRDSYIDSDFRDENQILGEWETKSELLQKVEYIYNEPSDTGIRTVLDGFWNSFQELSKTPESTPARSLVYQRGVALTDTINHTYSQLKKLQTQVNESIEIKVRGINSLSSQIGDINDLIHKIEASGDNANDLRDKRDLLVDELSKIVRINVHEDNRGMYTVSVSGAALVIGTENNQLEFDVNNLESNIIFEGMGYELIPNGGELKGLFNMRDDTIPKHLENLEKMAFALKEQVNAIHEEGYSLGADEKSELEFFITATGDNSLISVNPELADVEKIAAALGPPESDTGEESGTGDGRNALRIAQIRYDKIAGLGDSSIDDFTDSMIAVLGVDAQEAIRMTENQTLLLSQIEYQRESVSGVSLDEELTNMIKFQHAYNSAARMVTAIDEMLEVIVNRMGVVGR